MSAAAWWETLVAAAAAAAAVGGTAGSNTTVVSICVFTAVLCLCLVAGHLLEENKWVNESITALIIVRPTYSSLSTNSVLFSVNNYSAITCLILLLFFGRGASSERSYFCSPKGSNRTS